MTNDVDNTQTLKLPKCPPANSLQGYQGNLLRKFIQFYVVHDLYDISFKPTVVRMYKKKYIYDALCLVRLKNFLFVLNKVFSRYVINISFEAFPFYE